MNISPRVKRDIKAFYIAKRLQGKKFSQNEIKRIFQVRHVWAGVSKYYKYVCPPPGKGSAYYIVKESNLVQREYVLALLSKYYGPGDLWRANDRHITGTNLYVYHDEDDVSFWKLPKYGRIADWLPEDIEEHHIGKQIVNRQQVIIFLKMMKQQVSIPRQLNLFE